VTPATLSRAARIRERRGDLLAILRFELAAERARQRLREERHLGRVDFERIHVNLLFELGYESDLTRMAWSFVAPAAGSLRWKPDVSFGRVLMELREHS